MTVYKPSTGIFLFLQLSFRLVSKQRRSQLHQRNFFPSEMCKTSCLKLDNFLNFKKELNSIFLTIIRVLSVIFNVAIDLGKL